MLVACSVFDAVVGVYSPPQYFRAKGEALRNFMDVVAGDTHQFNQHPDDYSLFVLGTFDETTGECSWLNAPERLATARDMLRGDS